MSTPKARPTPTNFEEETNSSSQRESNLRRDGEMSKETTIDRVWGNIRVKGNQKSERDKNRIGEKGFGLGGGARPRGEVEEFGVVRCTVQ